ncbi:hypothetical protein GCM10011512_13090 [Tersicoccus solisilvae]|uniref:LysM domain-containing protein n=1 Tax=Tersicoccus solisilvae TaxID=1882339 RepID=A0ABQ1NZI9_9MICC|nr:LysM domain-containing protein [Tersicoccus solisilvae]GGC87525.1 hypothetical protein GCM10011512_13090 [Tersicoccus solisilvae]
MEREPRRCAIGRPPVRRRSGTAILVDLAPALAVLALGGMNAVVGGLLLSRLGEAPAVSASAVSAPFGDAGVEVAVGAVVSLVGVGVTGWWVLCLLVTLTAELRGRCGRTSTVPAGLSPVFIRRLVAVLLSAQLVAGTTTTAVAAVAAPTVTSAPILTAAGGVAAPRPDPGADPWFVPRAPAVQDETLLVRPPTRTTPTNGTTATVMAGDTLWSLAARQLGPLATDLEIARQWPRWHELNREVIGPDPGLIRPGQILQVPSAGGPSVEGEGR